MDTRNEPGDASVGTGSDPDARSVDPLPVVSAPAPEAAVPNAIASHASPSPRNETPVAEQPEERGPTPDLAVSTADQVALRLGALPGNKAPRLRRLPWLAACVGFSACLGGAAGAASAVVVASLAAPPPSAPAQQTRLDADNDIRALKETVAQLRAQLKSVGANVGALRASLNGTTSTTAGQLAKIAESVDRIGRAQAEHVGAERAQAEAVQAERARAERIQADRAAERRAASSNGPAAAGAAPAASSSSEGLGPSSAGGMTGEPQPGPPVIGGWVLRRARDGAALVEGRYGTIEIEPGDYLPGVGRVEAIRRHDGHWVVVTSKGLIVSAR
jgi:hypothetical protein